MLDSKREKDLKIKKEKIHEHKLSNKIAKKEQGYKFYPLYYKKYVLKEKYSYMQ